MFFGSEGLRAGWSLLLFFVLVSVLIYAVGFVIPMTKPLPGPQRPMALIRTDGMLLVVFAAASFLVSLVERRAFARYGLRREHAVRDLLAGLAWGVAMLSLLVGML